MMKIGIDKPLTIRNTLEFDTPKEVLVSFIVKVYSCQYKQGPIGFREYYLKKTQFYNISKNQFESIEDHI